MGFAEGGDGVKRGDGVPRACFHYMRGSCRYGAGCRYSHDADVVREAKRARREHYEAREAQKRQRKAAARPGLLRALLAKEIRAERSLLLQCIRVLVRQLDGDG